MPYRGIGRLLRSRRRVWEMDENIPIQGDEKDVVVFLWF